MISIEERKLALFIQTHQLKTEFNNLINNLKRQDYMELELPTSPVRTAYTDLRDLIVNFNSKGG